MQAQAPWWQNAPAFPFPVTCADRYEGGIFGFFGTRVPGDNHVSLVYGPGNRTYGISNCDDWLHARYVAALGNCGAEQYLDLPRQTLPYREDWGALAWLTTEQEYGHEWTSLVLGGTEDTEFVRCARLGLQTGVQEGRQALRDAYEQHNDNTSHNGGEAILPALFVGITIGIPAVFVLGSAVVEFGPRWAEAIRRKASAAGDSVRDAWQRRPRLPTMPQMPTLANLWPRQAASAPAAEAVPMGVLFTAGSGSEHPLDVRPANQPRAATPPPLYAEVEEAFSVALDDDTAAVLAEMEETAFAAPRPAPLARLWRLGQ